MKEPNTLKKWLLRLLKISLFAVISIFLTLHFYGYRIITEIDNPLMQFMVRGRWESPIPAEDLDGFTYFKVNSTDGLKIAAMISKTKKDTVKGTVILLHGIRSSKESYTSTAKWLNSIGFNAVAVDLRAHGNSEGTHCTFGFFEKYDIVAVVEVLENEGFNNIGIWGRSLGAAVAMQSMGIERRLEFGIIESTFTDMQTISVDYSARYLGTEYPVLTKYLVKRAGSVLDFDPQDASPLKYAQQITQPIIIVHGTADERIDIEYGRQNFKALSSNDKEFLPIENASHTNVWEVGGASYFKKLEAFLREQ